MLAYIVRRVIQSIIVVFCVGFVAFAIFQFVGDPIENMLGQERTDADIERLRAELGLDLPFPVQYLIYLGNVFEGDFGISYRQGRDVGELILERAPATLELALVSAIFAVIFGIMLGVYAAISRSRARTRPPRWALPAEFVAALAISTVGVALLFSDVDIADRALLVASPALTWDWINAALVLPLLILMVIRLILHPGTRAPSIMTGSLIGVSLPTFLIGILLIYLCSVQMREWAGVGLPFPGRRGTTPPDEWIGGWTTSLLTVDGWLYLIMPAITLGLFQMTLIMRLVRSEMLEVLRADYIRFARARGLKERTINFGHALKNTLVPVITIIGLQLGAIVAFAIITETVFNWPGVGLLFINSVQFVDIPVMAAYLMLISVMFVGINLAVDILYLLIDPRLRADRAAAAK